MNTLIDKSKKLFEMLSKKDNSNIILIIESDKDLDAFQRRGNQRAAIGFKEGIDKYSNLSESRVDYLIKIFEDDAAAQEKEEGSIDETLKILMEYCPGINSDRVNQNVANKFNKFYESIKSVHPSFNINEEVTWESDNGEAMQKFVDGVPEFCEQNGLCEETKPDEPKEVFERRKQRLFFESLQINENSTVDNIKKGLKDMDDTSVQLAFGIIFDKFKDYTSSMRDDIEKFFEKDPNSKYAKVFFGRYIGESLNEEQIYMNDADLRKYFDTDTAQELKASKAQAMVRQGKDGETYVVEPVGKTKANIKKV